MAIRARQGLFGRRIRRGAIRPPFVTCQSEQVSRMAAFDRGPLMKSYADIKAQIARLEKEADAALKQERAGVISRIREAIDVYGFTAQDLGFGGSARSKGKRRAASNRKTATST